MTASSSPRRIGATLDDLRAAELRLARRRVAWQHPDAL